MSNVDPEANALYARAENLHPHHWRRLAARAPEEAARAARAVWDGEAFTLSVLGRALKVDPARHLVVWGDTGASTGYQRALVAVHFLATALDAEGAEQFVAFRELPGGDAFFRGPHALNTPALEAVFGNDVEGFYQAAEGVGGRVVENHPPTVDFPALPTIRMRAFLWPADEEFAATAGLLIDSRCSLHLPLDVLWALANVAVTDLVRKKVPSSTHPVSLLSGEPLL